MGTKLQIFLVVFILAVASGGAFAREKQVAKSADFTAADLAGKGLVLLSTSADWTRQIGTVFMLKRIEPKKYGSKRLKYIDMFYADTFQIESHSATEHMNVHWRAIEPGEYVLERALADTTQCFQDFISYRFSVTAATSVYLGEFRVQDGLPAVRDNYQRDYTYFSEHTFGEKPAAFSPAFPVEKKKSNIDCFKHFNPW